MTEMTLQDAIAELKLDKVNAFSAGSFEDDGWDAATAEAIATILNAVASGALIPRTDAEQAVALAYQLAAYAVSESAEWPEDANDHTMCPALFARVVNAILALAPADALAEVERLKAGRDGAREALMNAGIALHVAKREAKAAEAEVARLREATDDWDGLWAEARIEAMKAMRKFPQPNYVISKIAEEAGEVVKAAIHCAEGRETAENVRGEMRQTIAMLYRLWVEGDQVHGLPPVRAALTTPEKDATK